jgi:hypothetical protein
MVERGADVEQVVPDEDGEFLGRRMDAAEVEDVFPARTFALGLHRLDHRVFAALPQGAG